MKIAKRFKARIRMTNSDLVRWVTAECCCRGACLKRLFINSAFENKRRYNALDGFSPRQALDIMLRGCGLPRRLYTHASVRDATGALEHA
jgi:hypothetical protein